MNEEMATVASEFSSVQKAVDAIGRGEVVIVVDAEDRENEGDFICAAEKATPDVVNFILSGRGEFCVPVLPETCKRLGLSPLVDSNTAPLSTAFMTPIDTGRQKRESRPKRNRSPFGL